MSSNLTRHSKFMFRVKVKYRWEVFAKALEWNALYFDSSTNEFAFKDESDAIEFALAIECNLLDYRKIGLAL